MIVTSLPGHLIALRSACCATLLMTVITRLLKIYGLSIVRRGEARRITDGTLEVVSYTWSPDGSQVMLVASQDMRIEGSCDERLYLVSTRWW